MNLEGLPEGWTAARNYLQPGCVTLTSPAGSQVSVNFRYRLYALGGLNPRFASDRQLASTRERGWQAQLVKDAVDYLERQK